MIQDYKRLSQLVKQCVKEALVPAVALRFQEFYDEITGVAAFQSKITEYHNVLAAVMVT